MAERDCWAVIFTTKLKGDATGYAEAADRMVALAKNQPGFIDIEAARGADGVGITVSYWESLEAIAAWREHAEHKLVQAQGRATFYERYSLRVSHVVRSVTFP